MADTALAERRAWAIRVQAEAELDKARPADVPARDLLASIRTRLGFGPPAA